MDYLKSMEQYDFSQYEAGAVDPVRTDVSYSGEDMQTSTATGNGSGVFLDSGWQNALFGAIPKVVDYALQRDAVKMGMVAPMGQPTTQQQVQVQGKQTNFMFLALCGLGIYIFASQGAK